MIIAMDGTASSGKSSISKALAAKLSIPYLTTGSIYRAIALKLLNLNISAEEDERIKQTLATTKINSFFLNGQSIIETDRMPINTSLLNSPEVSSFTPKIACKDYVREYVRKIQREQASKNKNIIVEGRDIGSVVFPNADAKIFIDADVKTRASRRLADYQKQGKTLSLEQVISELENRDNEDRSRHLSPLIMTSDSIILDTSSLSIEQSVNQIIKILKEKGLTI